MSMIDEVASKMEEFDAVAQTFEPQLHVIPAWAVEDFESQGGVFAGKVARPDGNFTITGIERFTDAYVRQINHLARTV